MSLRDVRGGELIMVVTFVSDCQSLRIRQVSRSRGREVLVAVISVWPN
jgi:hypothetical protein